jgi:pimeloyl-ACP methyl ester carboxylesterase
MQTEQLEPCFFGAGQRLYGCFHVPPASGGSCGRARELAVLVVAPFGHEYQRAHRALRTLAARLAAAGFGTLRFDLTGSGDSAGDEPPASLAAWLDDLVDAARELKRRSRSRRIAAVGLRLGGTLALAAAGRGLELERLVLWEPVADGRRCVAAWRELHGAFLRSVGRPPDEVPGPPGADLECLGTLVPAALVAEIEALGADTLPRPSCTVRMIGGADALAERLTALGVDTRFEPYEGAPFWQEDVDKALVPARTLERIVALVTEAAP